MRKIAAAILFCTITVSIFFLLQRQSPDNRSDNSALNSSQNNLPPTASSEASNGQKPRWTKPDRTGGSATEVESAPSAAVVHGPTEFSRGEMQNVIVDGGIRLGNNPAFVPRFNQKYRLFGNYISPEQTSETPFDSFQANIEIASLNNNEVTFEIRTRSTFGTWSEWREVDFAQMKEPISTEAPADAWQYRIVLFGNDPATGPQINSVSIQPQTNFSANNAR